MRNPTFVTLSDGTIRNAYDLRIRNKNPDERVFLVAPALGPDLTLEIEGRDGNTIAVPADTQGLTRVYLMAPPESAAAALDRTEIRLWVEDLASGERAHADTTFNGKGQ